MDLHEIGGFYWNKYLKDKGVTPGQLERPKIAPSSVQGVNALAKHLYAAGGPAQQSRMIQDKRRTLDKAVLYSYQGAFVKKYIQDYVPLMDNEQNQPPVRALINPNKVKQDYDDKVISIGYEYNFEPGTVFEWCQTGTYWLIYLQDLTELAYFRGDIRRCSYIIRWLDENNEEKHTYAALRGPVETRINSIQKNGNVYDNPNYSLNMLIPKNKDTLTWCKRYAKFLLSDGENTVCWRIEAVDSYSMKGVIEFTAVEYYINKEKDDVENELVDGKIPTGEILTFANVEQEIEGEGFIRPKKVYNYVFVGSMENGTWGVDADIPVIYKCSESDKGQPQIRIKWNSAYSGQFDLKFTNGENTVVKTIVVESLF